MPKYFHRFIAIAVDFMRHELPFMAMGKMLSVIKSSNSIHGVLQTLGITAHRESVDFTVDT